MFPFRQENPVKNRMLYLGTRFSYPLNAKQADGRQKFSISPIHVCNYHSKMPLAFLRDF